MRKLTCVLIAILICLITVSCSNQDRVVALEISSHRHGTDSGDHKYEYNLWSPENLNMHEDSTAPETIEVKFMDKVYKGTYQYSVVHLFNNYQTDLYWTDYGYLQLKHGTKEVVGIDIDIDIDSQEDAAKYTLDYCRDVAEKFLENYIKVRDYEVEVIDNGTSYIYRYTRYIDGIRTCEGASVSVSASTGKIRSFSSAMLGSFNDKDESVILSAVEKIESASSTELEKKLNHIYSDLILYNIKDKIIVRLKDGSIGIVYEVSVVEKPSYNGQSYNASNTVSILIALK